MQTHHMALLLVTKLNKELQIKKNRIMFGSTNSEYSDDKADQYLEKQFIINCMNGINTWLLNGSNNIKHFSLEI